MHDLKFDGQKQRFDITIPKDVYTTWEDLHTKLSSWCSKFAFQLEKGATGYEHWQCRVNLISKKTAPSLKTEVIPVVGGHWSLTSAATHSGPKAFNYVMKEDTRIEGPWDDSSVARPRVLTDQLINFHKYESGGKLYHWQHKARELVKQYHERHLHYIYDPHYNSGKSITCEWLEYHGLAEEIPSIYVLAEDVMQFAMSMPKAKCYLFDMPAAMKKSKMSQLYTALEMLKNGFLFDKRYNGKKLRINRPGVICFANNLPDRTLMAPDRWVVWYLTENKELVPYDSPFGRSVPDLKDQFGQS